MRKRIASLVLLGSLALAGCSETSQEAEEQGPTAPGVVGAPLDLAKTEFDALGISEDDIAVEGGGLFGILDEANWEVCSQVPEAGAPLTATAQFTVERDCAAAVSRSAAAETLSEENYAEEPTESATTEETTTIELSEETTSSRERTPSSTDEPTPTPAASAPADEAITPESNAEFAAILQSNDSCDVKIEAFATNYDDRLLEFNAAIYDMAPHENYTTRYNILLLGGDFNPESGAPGPSFRFTDVNTVNDLNWQNDSATGRVGVGNNLRVVARVDEYTPNSCLFHLEPVETSFR